MDGLQPSRQHNESFFSTPLTYRPSRNPSPVHTTGTSQLPSKSPTSFVFHGANNTHFSQNQSAGFGLGFQNVPYLPPAHQSTTGYLPRDDGLAFSQASQAHLAVPQRESQQAEPYIAHPSYATRPSLAKLLLSLSPPSTLEATNPIPSPELPSIATPKDPEPPLHILEAFNANILKPTEEWRDENVATLSALAIYIASQQRLHFNYGYKYMQAFVPTVDVDDGSKRENVRFLIADQRGNRKQRLRKRYVRVEDVQQRTLPVMPERQLGEWKVREVIEDDGNEFEEGDV